MAPTSETGHKTFPVRFHSGFIRCGAEVSAVLNQRGPDPHVSLYNLLSCFKGSTSSSPPCVLSLPRMSAAELGAPIFELHAIAVAGERGTEPPPPTSSVTPCGHAGLGHVMRAYKSSDCTRDSGVAAEAETNRYAAGVLG